MKENSKALNQILWEGADILRSKMDANDYKDYLLGFVFYKYLSDKLLMNAYRLWADGTPGTMAEAQQAYEAAIKEDGTEFQDKLKKTDRYLIDPELTYTKLVDKANHGKFQREELQKAFNEVANSDPLFAHLFDDVDLYSNRLGTGEIKQSQTIMEVLKKVNEANIMEYSGDVLGDAYEYMIGQFASETGKKAGEFYTPRAVSMILAQIVMQGQENVEGMAVYDPAMGSASLLLTLSKYSHKPGLMRYYGQELVTSTYNIARMNMFLHGIAPENQHLHNADTLDADWPTDEVTDFHAVVMNPPYSQNWTAAQGFLSDPRFSDYGELPPKSKADYAFLLHGLYHLKNSENGANTMAIILPHGVLFRGGKEGKIRQKLLEAGSIYAVIGLPANLFYNTSIPTIIIVLKKTRPGDAEARVGRDVLFIDASQEFERGKNQNALTDGHIAAIVKMYQDRKDIEKHAHLATFEEIQQNDFNLNIPRYVDTFEPEPEIDLQELAKDMVQTDQDIQTVQAELLDGLKELTTEDEATKQGLEQLMKVLE